MTSNEHKMAHDVLTVTNMYNMVRFLTSKNGYSEITAMQQYIEKRVRTMPETHVCENGVIGGSMAFMSPSKLFGHDGTQKVLQYIYGYNHVECAIHGWQKCHISHVVPCSVGGILRVQTYANGAWRNISPKVLFTTITPLRILNATAECGECNRQRAQKFDDAIRDALRAIPYYAVIPVDGDTQA